MGSTMFTKARLSRKQVRSTLPECEFTRNLNTDKLQYKCFILNCTKQYVLNNYCTGHYRCSGCLLNLVFHSEQETRLNAFIIKNEHSIIIFCTCMHFAGEAFAGTVWSISQLVASFRSWHRPFASYDKLWG